jgi:hypothetical protein
MGSKYPNVPWIAVEIPVLSTGMHLEALKSDTFAVIEPSKRILWDLISLWIIGNDTDM